MNKDAYVINIALGLIPTNAETILPPSILDKDSLLMKLLYNCVLNDVGAHLV